MGYDQILKLAKSNRKITWQHQVIKQYGTLQHHGSIMEAKKLSKLTNYHKQKLQKYRIMAATISTQISSKHTKQIASHTKP